MKLTSASSNNRVVYVVGAGLSAGLNFPTIHDLLPKMWDRLPASRRPMSSFLGERILDFQGALCFAKMLMR
jgi:NAD-dependent SIR2 family protein deacetylase